MSTVNESLHKEVLEKTQEENYFSREVINKCLDNCESSCPSYYECSYILELNQRLKTLEENESKIPLYSVLNEELTPLTNNTGESNVEPELPVYDVQYFINNDNIISQIEIPVETNTVIIITQNPEQPKLYKFYVENNASGNYTDCNNIPLKYVLNILKTYLGEDLSEHLKKLNTFHLHYNTTTINESLITVEYFLTYLQTQKLITLDYDTEQLEEAIMQFNELVTNNTNK